MICKSGALVINDHHTDIIYNIYHNRIFIIVSQYKKLGSLVSVVKESTVREFDNNEAFSTKVIFGKDEPEIQAAARYIVGELKVDKPVLISICLKDFEVSTLRTIVKAIKNIATQIFLHHNMSTIFGQLVIGPPDSGKTTYCGEMGKFLESLGRKVAIINIDPANENMDYKPAVEISELVKHEEVMKIYKLGPNGALIYCIEFLEKNVDWLLRKILNLKDYYLLIDCPGQVELYTHHEPIKNITEKLQSNLVRLCYVNLMDSHHCSDPSKYLSAVIVCTITMLQQGLPRVNIMTKLDEMKRFSDKLDFNINFYTEVLDLKYLLKRLSEDDIDPH